MSLTQQLFAPADGNPANSTIALAPVSWSVGYDRVGRITKFDSAGQTTSFSYDTNGNRTASTRSSNGLSTSRTYTLVDGGRFFRPLSLLLKDWAKHTGVIALGAGLNSLVACYGPALIDKADVQAFLKKDDDED